MDLIIILLLFAAIIVIYKDVKFVVYSIGILEIFFRLVHAIGKKLTIANIDLFINDYIPKSIFAVFKKYTTGIVYEIIYWILIVGFIVFLYYLIRYMIKKK